MSPISLFIFAGLCLLAETGIVVAAERHMMLPLVPPDSLAEARALRNPLPDSPEIVERGKTIYRGKGTCVNCHGTDGRGDGPAAAQLNPSPRNFHHRGFWRHRTEGEIFWVIKNGSPGTSMIGFGSQLSDEEIWAVVRYLRTFAGSPRGRHGMGRGWVRGHRGMDSRQGMGGGGCCMRRDSVL